jgi:tetratricopeptide (TPR) repeat protein
MLRPTHVSLAALLFTPAAIILTHQTAVAQSATQVANTAKQITVLIQGQNPGSGVIIRREGNTYTVLTARHVVATPDEYEIVTPDGQKHRLNYSTVKPLPGVDLATLEFTSTTNYPVAKLGNSRMAPSGTTVYVAGFPAPTAAITQRIFNFTEGNITANADRPLADGYTLVYSNNTLPGMSGGPVLNGRGEVIGIHGKGDIDTTSTRAVANPNIALKTGFNLAIPINTFLHLSSQTGVTGFRAPSPAPIPVNLTADDLYLRAISRMRLSDNRGAITEYTDLIRLNPNNANAFVGRGLARAALGDHKEAIKDYNEAIRLRPQFADAYDVRGLAHAALGDHKQAVKDYNEAIRLKPQYADAYNNRGLAHAALGDHKQAIQDYDEAIQLKPQYADAYNNRGLAHAALGDHKQAIQDYNEAIRLKPRYASALYNRGVARSALGRHIGAISDYIEATRINSRDASAYNNRGVARSDLGDKQDAITNYTEAIRLNPQYAIAYNNRGNARRDTGDRQGAITDYQSAADLARAQGDQQLYEKAIQNLRRLQQQQ